MNSIRLRDIERQNWRNLQRDGLMDLLFGVLLLTGAVVAALDEAAVAEWLRIATLFAIPFSSVGLVSWMRKRYVVPRLGRARFLERRARQTRRMRVTLAACVLATVALVALTALSPRLGIRMPGDLGAWLIISAVILFPIGAIALFLDCPRFLLYGGLFVAVEFLHIVVRLPNRVPFGSAIAYGAAACIALAVGIALYVRFLRAVPRPVVPETTAKGGACGAD